MFRTSLDFFISIFRLSIVQLSLRDSVYILDVIALAEKVKSPSLLSFGNDVFANEKVLKLGTVLNIYTDVVNDVMMSLHKCTHYVLIFNIIL